MMTEVQIKTMNVKYISFPYRTFEDSLLSKKNSYVLRRGLIRVLKRQKKAVLIFILLSLYFSGLSTFRTHIVTEKQNFTSIISKCPT